VIDSKEIYLNQQAIKWLFLSIMSISHDTY
jgi:hypothetical protein